MGDGKQEKLSISDWISFLCAEKNSNISNIFSLAAFVLAAFALIVSQDHNNNIFLVVDVIYGADMLLLLWWWLSNLFGRRGRKAEKLLDDIMSGRERDVSRIESQWKEFLVEENRKKTKSDRTPSSLISKFRNKSTKSS